VKQYSHKYAILLAAIVAVAVVESFSHRQLLGLVVSDFVVSTTYLLILLVVFDRGAQRAVAFAIFATAVAATWAHHVMPPDYPDIMARLIFHSALLLLFGFATIVILLKIFQQRVVRSDDVLGAVCGYLLAGGAWANVFTLLEVVVPGSFSLGEGFGFDLVSWHGRMAVMNYVSLGALTSVGSGDVVPVRAPSTVLTSLEAVFGQFYIAVVVAQLVGARLSQPRERNHQAGE